MRKPRALTLGDRLAIVAAKAATGVDWPDVAAALLMDVDGPLAECDYTSANAVELARTPVFDRLWAEYPHTTLEASGKAVGLPPGQMGNSEVGHLNIGAGRVVMQDHGLDKALDQRLHARVAAESGE